MSNVLQFPTTFKGFRKARRPKACLFGVVTAAGRIEPYDIVYEESAESARLRRIDDALDKLISKLLSPRSSGDAA